MAFLVNEPVTQSDLNNIAVDLGDAEFSAFNSNKFGVDALNAITADLVTSGVLRTLDMCKPTLTNSNVNIEKGVIVFSDGAKLRITSPVSITAVANAYVAAKYDSANGTCSLVSVAEIPTETGVEYMKLAQVNADCTAITDLRTMATDKKAAYKQASKNVILTVRLNELESHRFDFDDGDYYTYKDIILSKYDVPENFYPQFVACRYDGSTYKYNFIKLPETTGDAENPTWGSEIQGIFNGVYFSRIGTGVRIKTSVNRDFDDCTETIYVF